MGHHKEVAKVCEPHHGGRKHGCRFVDLWERVRCAFEDELVEAVNLEICVSGGRRRTWDPGKMW